MAEQATGKRLFLGLLLLSGSLLGGTALGLMWLPMIYDGIVGWVPALIGAGLALLTLAVSTGIGICVFATLFERDLPGTRKLRGLLIKVFFPVLLVLGKLLGISKERVEGSYVAVNNQLVLRSGRQGRPEKFLILLPHCLQVDSCDIRITGDINNCRGCGRCPIAGLVEVGDRYGVTLSVATGGTIARRLIVDMRPEMIIAVACERDLTSGIQDAHPLPVYGILNERPEGPCRNTLVDLDKVDDALALLTRRTPAKPKRPTDHEEDAVVMQFSEIVELMDSDLAKVEAQFESNLASGVSLIPKVGQYILSGGGKRVRPMMLLLAARLCGYLGDRAIPLASIMEFIHTATLLHDDVVDNANLRRGQVAANNVFGNEASVLVGDFLFSKSFSLMTSDGDVRILKAVSNATTRMAEGEVLQLVNTCDLNLSEAGYLEVVINKTAILIAAACEVGAILGEADHEKVEALKRFGMDVGIAFQLVDDCLDYVANESEFGKAIGTDLLEGKITLPLIHTVANCTEEEKAQIGKVVEKDEITDDDLSMVIGLIRKYDGIEFTRDKAVERIEAAKARLEVFDDSPEKMAMLGLANYVVSRSK